MLADILFGLPMSQTGVRWIWRNRQRVVTYAVTIVLKKYNKRFIKALHERLNESYPASPLSSQQELDDKMIHIHFRNVNYFAEYTPLLVVYIVLFLYIYFSVSK